MTSGRKLTVGSLFAGIGGLELGLERTGGFETVWQVEIDPYATKVLEKHWPNVRRWDDVQTFPPAGDWGVDLICGGFPCQDISFAGKGAGLQGERSGLFYAAIRVAATIKPRYVLLENVAALLSRGMGTVVAELASLGYCVEWHCIPAAYVGAPHIRDRVFIVAYADRQRRGEAWGFKERRWLGWSSVPAYPNSISGGQEGSRLCAAQAGGRRQGAGPTDVRHDVSDAHGVGLQGSGSQSLPKWGQVPQSIVRGGRGDTERDNWEAEPDVGRVAHGVPSRVDRLRCLGNAVVPQVAQFVGEMILDMERRA